MYPTKKLSEIAKTTSGWTPSRDKKEFWWGVIPWLKSWELSDNLNITQSEEFITEEWLNNSSTKIFKKGTLLIAMYGATAGKLWILWIDATTNQAVCSIQNNYNQFVEKYIYYFLFSIRERIIKDSFWWAQPNISKWYLDKLEIPLPPLSIQSRIVAKLDEAFGNIDKQIELLKGNIEDVEIMKKSVMGKVFEIWKYEMKKLNEICNKITDGSHNPPKWIESGIPMISSRNLEDNNINFDNIRFISEADYIIENKRTCVDEWDILLSIVWTIWKVCIVRSEFWRFTMQRSLSVLKINQEKVLPFFIYYYLNSDFVQKELNDGANWAAQKWIYLNQIKEITIPFPSLPRQHEIVAHLDAVFDKTRILRSEYESQIQDLEIMKQSLLEEAFAGRLVQENEA